MGIWAFWIDPKTSSLAFVSISTWGDFHMFPWRFVRIFLWHKPSWWFLVNHPGFAGFGYPRQIQIEWTLRVTNKSIAPITKVIYIILYIYIIINKFKLLRATTVLLAQSLNCLFFRFSPWCTVVPASKNGADSLRCCCCGGGGRGLLFIGIVTCCTLCLVVGWWLRILVGGLEHEFYLSIYWECHRPNWRTHIFQIFWNHQPGMVRISSLALG